MLTLYGSGTAFNGEEDGEDGVGDAVVHHVAFPLDFDLSARLHVHGYAAHDFEAGDVTIDFFVGVLFFHVCVAIHFCVPIH